MSRCWRGEEKAPAERDASAGEACRGACGRSRRRRGTTQAKDRSRPFRKTDSESTCPSRENGVRQAAQTPLAHARTSPIAEPAPSGAAGPAEPDAAPAFSRRTFPIAWQAPRGSRRRSVASPGTYQSGPHFRQTVQRLEKKPESRTRLEQALLASRRMSIFADGCWRR